jgi:hypothetical protein
MDIETVAKVAEIIGGIAILVSLIYVGYQIRQSNRIARVESIRVMQSMAFMDNFDMADIGRAFNGFDSLDYSAKWEFHVYFLNLWGHWQVIFDSYHLGLISEADLSSWLRVMAGIFRTEGAQQYFAHSGSNYLMQHSLQHIKDYIKKNSATIKPYNEEYKWMIETGKADPQEAKQSV